MRRVTFINRTLIGCLLLMMLNHHAFAAVNLSKPSKPQASDLGALLKPRPISFRQKVKKQLKAQARREQRKAKGTYRSRKIGSLGPKAKSPVTNSKSKTAKVKHPFSPVDQRPYFDIPVTYNARVKKWIKHFQTTGKRWFQRYLERSHRYLPAMKRVLRNKSLPQDLAYIAMIESGFSPHAVSTANAVGYWQFIKPTANRYGLKTSWWIDERRDFHKSTMAAAKYLGDLYKLFDSWYLTACGYNMGETRLRKLVKRHGTSNFWHLSKKKDFPKETREYIPKMLAAMLIAKSPELYGFKNLRPQKPHSYEYYYVPGGTDLILLAEALNLPHNQMKRLNPEIIQGFIPEFVKNHRIRIPKGYTVRVANLIKETKVW
jgi:membrane-bound lytic murein transglycosylase D